MRLFEAFYCVGGISKADAELAIKTTRDMCEKLIAEKFSANG